ncbi:MAG: hypothetical protein HYR68_01685 [Burkholderiales bacterium]|nr:hypothetical protein [Burkholderiales bacterium]
MLSWDDEVQPANPATPAPRPMSATSVTPSDTPVSGMDLQARLQYAT